MDEQVTLPFSLNLSFCRKGQRCGLCQDEAGGSDAEALGHSRPPVVPWVYPGEPWNGPQA